MIKVCANQLYSAVLTDMDFQTVYKRLFKYRRWIAGSLAGGLFLNRGLCHLFPMNLFMPMHAELSTEDYSFEHLITLVRETKSDLNINEHIHPFIADTSVCLCAGYFGLPASKQSPVIGIPKPYFCSNIYDVEDLKIRISKSDKCINSNGGEQELAFLESLVFSEGAQKFDVARQIAVIKDKWALGQSIISPLFVFVGYLAIFPGVKLLFATGKSVSFFRILQWQFLCLIATVILCQVAKNAFSYFMVKSTDHTAASVSKEYALGAIEFCQNNRKTNKALRVLLGKKGEKLYSADGDFKSAVFMNRKEPSLIKRQQHFQEVLKTFE